MSLIIPPSGPIPAKIMIVGEAPGADEEFYKRPFVGQSGKELDKMLQEAGIARSECFVTNVCRIRPPKNDISQWIAKSKKQAAESPGKFVSMREKMVVPAIRDGFILLIKEIELVQPNIVIPCGNLAMWAITGKWGVVKWRGSMLNLDTDEMKQWVK